METVIFKDTRTGKEISEALKQLDRRSMIAWAAECAEQVLPIFEQYVPQDNRPRRAIEAGQAWARKEIPMSEARAAAFAAHAAARDAGNAAATAAARAAGHAAATAHVAGHAAHAATYAAKAAAYASTTEDAADAVAKIREWQYRQVLLRETSVRSTSSGK